MAVKFASRDQDIPLDKLIRHEVYGSMFGDMTGERREKVKASLRDHGQELNIVVIKTKVDGKEGYGVIDGYQRWQLATELGWKEIKADIVSAGSWLNLSEEDRKKFCENLNEHRRHLQFGDQAKQYADGKKAKGGRPKKTSAESAQVLDSANPEENSDSSQHLAKDAGYSSTRTAQVNSKLFKATIPAVHQAIAEKTITKEEAKQIAKVPKLEQEDALERAIAGQPIMPPKPEPEKPVIVDSLGKPVPESLQDIFLQVPKWQKAMRAVSDLKSTIKELADHPSGTHLDIDDVERLLKQTRTHLKFGLPYTECPKCRRKPTKQCTHCRGGGWLTEPNFNSCASDPDKAWLEARK